MSRLGTGDESWALPSTGMPPPLKAVQHGTNSEDETKFKAHTEEPFRYATQPPSLPCAASHRWWGSPAPRNSRPVLVANKDQLVTASERAQEGGGGWRGRTLYQSMLGESCMRLSPLRPDTGTKVTYLQSTRTRARTVSVHVNEAATSRRPLFWVGRTRGRLQRATTGAPPWTRGSQGSAGSGRGPAPAAGTAACSTPGWWHPSAVNPAADRARASSVAH